ncbi:ribonuclease P protein component 1 [Halorussus marinus]|uniref:ribonuclease P protein component 1 n=1 Tax=Halorussus marinus TaxID=2505976 RepID=UPI001092503F|nr:ribonuclease P protein component 1 [Halorussus marinus]
MPLTPETLTRHELNGLSVRVVDAANPDLVGIEGRVVAETRATLSVASADRVRQVQKQGSTFEFALTDEPADCSGPRSEPRPVSRDGAAKESGTASKRGSETAGGRSGQSGHCEGVAYVTVDGARLLSRPELRTEKAGESRWQ